MNARLIVLLAALAATLAAVWWVGERAAEEEAVSAVISSAPRPDLPSSRTQPAVTQQNAARPAGLTVDRGARFQALGPDLFPVHSWQPPPPPPPEPLPPPPPTAPSLPFQFLGRWQEGGEEVYFLAQGQQVHSLKRGDAIGLWRLEETAPAGLVFTYVPLNERRTLRLTP
jgi:hypothetical protein